MTFGRLLFAFPELGGLAGPRHALVPRWRLAPTSYDHALAHLREALREGSAITQDCVELAQSLGYRSSPTALEAVADYLARAIACGDLVMLRMPDPPVSGTPILRGASVPPRWEDIPLISDLRETPATEEFAWLGVEVVDHRGTPFAGLVLTILHSGGTRARVVLDHLGRYILPRLDNNSPVELLWSSPFPSAPAGSLTLDGFKPAASDISIPGSEAAGRVTLPSVNRMYRLVVTAQAAACVRLIGMLFELNKSFLLPAATEGIRLLAHMYRTMPDPQVLVVGHTDRTGKKYRNDSLSLERAEAVIAYLRDDVDAWLANYLPSKDHSRRWGAGEDLMMLSAVPRGGVPYYSPEHAEHTLAAAARRLQEAHGLVVDGEIGVASRRALITEYLGLDGTSLPGKAHVVAHGCGEHFPRVATDDEVEELENRRVEVFFFPERIAPTPTSSNSAAGDPYYPAWLDAVVEERTFTPSALGRGRLLVVTDYDPSYAALEELVVELRAVDGSYARGILGREAGLHPSGTLSFEFDDIPIGTSLTLIGRTQAGDEHVWFDDVAYLVLSTLAPQGDLHHPFAVDESRPRSWWEEALTEADEPAADEDGE